MESRIPQTARAPFMLPPPHLILRSAEKTSRSTAKWSMSTSSPLWNVSIAKYTGATILDNAKRPLTIATNRSEALIRLARVRASLANRSTPRGTDMVVHSQVIQRTPEGSGRLHFPSLPPPRFCDTQSLYTILSSSRPALCPSKARSWHRHSGAV